MFSKLNRCLIKTFSEYSDQELLNLIQKSSAEAFEVLYYRYFATLCHTAFKRIQNTDLVEELVQDVFVNLWQKRFDLDVSGSVTAYLFATLRNKILHEVRRQMISSKNLLILQKEISVGYADNGYELETKETEQKIQLVLQSLSPKCREAFTLSRFENLSYRAIANQMNISVNTVEKHICKALNHLKKRIQR